MQFEDFDNKLRDAADQHHPNYDEKAWAKMEKLLDKHLPQKDDRRRRIIFFLLFLFLLGGGLWLYIGKPWQSGKLANDAQRNSQPESEQVISSSPLKEEKADETKSNSPLKEEQGKASATTISSTMKDDNDVVVLQDNKNTGAVVAEISSQKVTVKSKTTKRQASSDNGFDMQVSPGSIGRNSKTGKEEIKVDNAQSGTVASGNNTVVAPGADNKNNAVTGNDAENSIKTITSSVDDKEQQKIVPAKKDSTLAEQPQEAKEKPVAKKGRSRKTNALFFSVSAGPDISSVGLDNPGKVKLLTGAGLGYTFKDRWTVRTGFYSVSKIYTAAPGDYKPVIPLTNTAYLKDISADCKVYEIPLNLAYNFGRSEKHRTFAALGLSSFIMKKEAYTYEYRYPGAPPYYYTHTEDNKYKHYFSVLSLSGGYQRRISRTVSITVEPYLKLPLAGVGYGKIKLNSGGVLFSLNVSPFQQATKKQNNR